jgi:hypothetical protein
MSTPARELMPDPDHIFEQFSTRHWDWDLYKRIEATLTARIAARLESSDPPRFSLRASDRTGLIADETVTDITQLQRWLSENHEKPKKFTLTLLSSYDKAVSRAELEVTSGYGGPLGSISVTSQSREFLRDVQRDFKELVASHKRWRRYRFLKKLSKGTWSLIVIIVAALIAAAIIH